MIGKLILDKFENSHTVDLPRGSVVESTGNVLEEIAVWYSFDPTERRTKKMQFSLTDTDGVVIDLDVMRYLGTVILHGGVYVRHVYVSKN